MYTDVVGDELIENMSTAKTFTVPPTAKRFIAQAKGGEVHIRLSGQTATSNLSFTLAEGEFSNQLPVHPTNVSVIADDNTPKLFVTYFG